MADDRRRDGLLREWAHYLARAARRGKLSSKGLEVSRVETIAGPRAGALELFAGLDSGALLRSLSANDCASLRQFVPWRFTGEPQAFMAGRFVRVEAGWPGDLAETCIRLGEISEYPRAGGRWVAGRSETGATVVPSLSDQTPHFLFSGATGSGKSVALRSAVLQLSRDPQNELVLIDGKAGEGLRPVQRLPGVVGPVATEWEQIQAALGYACERMRERYARDAVVGRVVVVFDEFQEYSDDDVTTNLMRKLAAQGRAAGVHLLAGTQHPTVDSFGDATTRRNLTGKIALRVEDPDASRVAVGGRRPRADWLLGAGDSYTVGPGACHRVQLAFIDREEIEAEEGEWDGWRFNQWPAYDPEAVGQELEEVGWSYTGGELAVGVVAAAHGDGRPTMVKRLEEQGMGSPGAERAIRLLRLGRGCHDALERMGYAVCLSGDAQGDPSGPADDGDPQGGSGQADRQTGGR